MVILALDTTTAHGSLALALDGRLLEAQTGDPAVRQGQRLPGDIEAVLARHGLTTASVDRYVVALGPGSFTGLRVGIATIQALALVHGRPVVGLSVMDVLVDVATRSQPRHGGPGAPEVVIPWVDAKRGEVFAAMYGPESNGTPGSTWAVLDGPVALAPDALLDRWAETVSARRVLVIGDGVPETRALLDARLSPGWLCVDQLPPLAGVMAKMAGVEPWSEQLVMPHALRPVYVRRHYAALARDNMHTASQSGDRPDMDSASDQPA